MDLSGTLSSDDTGRPVGSDDGDADQLSLVVIDQNGVPHRLQALEGWRVMEVIRDWDVPIKAECGGACACGTCHVYVDSQWLDKLVPATSEEEDQLDLVAAVEANSRLSCQILMRPDLNGLTVTLAPGSEP